MRPIIYVMSGAAHLPYLIVSLRSLRRHYDGPVWVYAWPESFNQVLRIGQDRNLAITPRRWDPSYRGKNDQFICKQQVLMALDEYQVDTALYLDADTIITGSLDHLHEQAAAFGFCATQFCDWPSNRGVVSNRIQRLRDFSCIDAPIIDALLTNPYPSVNGGVFACRPESAALKLWHQWSRTCGGDKCRPENRIFIADETCLHAVMLKLAPEELFTVVEGGAFNCSPKYQPKSLPDREVKVWHFHGDSNVRPEKSDKGYYLWWGEYQQCLESNVGYIHDWKHTVDNKYLNKLEA